MGSGVRAAIVVAVALASVGLPKIALFAGLFVLLSALSAPKAEPPARRRFVLAHVAAGSIVFLASVRFLATDALSGIVEGGTRAAGVRAVSRLREILFVEDAARQQALWDPDGDGVGSALFLAELTGERGMRGGRRVVPPLLERYPRLELTGAGPAAEMGGFWFLVCVPAKGGELAADPALPVDDELAERRFVAYAWPTGEAPGLSRAYFLDQHERILTAPSSDGVRSGAQYPPRCNDALAPPTRDDWRPWREKKPRTTLPGDRSG